MKHDLRLLPAALVTWGIAAFAVGMPTRVVAAVLTVMVIGGLLAYQVSDPRQRENRARSVFTQMLLIAAAGVMVTTSVATKQVVSGAGAISHLIQDEATVHLIGQVVAPPRPVNSTYEERYLVHLRVEQVSGRGISGTAAARLIAWGDDAWGALQLGERIEISGQLRPTAPGDVAIAELRPTTEPVTLSEPEGLDRLVTTIRTRFPAALAYAEPDIAALAQGIAIGNDSALSAHAKAAMRTTSLTHLTAVSGAHFAIIAGALFALGMVAGWPLWARLGVTALGLAAVIVVVGPEPSVLRGGAMAAIGLTAVITGRGRSAMTALSAAVILLVTADPWLGRSLGFILSVVATAALILVATPLASWLTGRVPRWLAFAVSVPLAAQLACTPILLMVDPYLATYGVLANLLALPAVAVATIFGLLAALIAPVSVGVATVISMPAYLASAWILWVATTLAGWPAARLTWPGGWAGVTLFLVLVMVTLLAVRWWQRVNRRRRLIAAAMIGVTAVIAVTAGVIRPRSALPSSWDVIACDVGQGAATLVRTTAGAILIDAGPPGGDVAACLHAGGVTHLALLVLSHPHADHVGGLEEVLQTVSVADVLVPPIDTAKAREVDDILQSAGVEVHTTSHGWHGQVGEVSWQVLWPPDRVVSSPDTGADNSAINDASLSMHFTWPSGFTLITLGDLEADGQNRLLAANPGQINATALMVSHHGSANQSATLLDLIAPHIAIVSVGENDYGHPHPATLDLLADVVVVRTDECGTFALSVGGDTVAVTGCG